MAKVFSDRRTYHNLAALANDILRAKAEEIRALASAAAASHSDTGQYAASFNVRKANSLDYEIYSSDPNGVPKEFGHHAPNGHFIEGVGALLAALRGI